jgi:drug/metabolite transporter (DMT)-like permease
MCNRHWIGTGPWAIEDGERPSEPSLSSIPSPRTGPAGARAFDRIDLMLYAVVVVVWGTSWIALHYQLGVVSPEVSLVWRFGLATLIMLVLALARGERLAFPLRDHAGFLVVGALLFSGNFLLFYYGGLAVASGLLAVVFSLASVGNLLLGRIVLGQRVDPVVAIGGLLGVAGVAAMFAPEIASGAVGVGSAGGLALCVVGTLLFCSGNIAATSVRRRGASIVAYSFWGMVYGTGCLALVALVRGQPFVIEATSRYVLSLVYLSSMASVLAFAAYLRLMDRVGAARAGYTTVLIPVVALLISTVAEGYRWTAPALAGLALVLVGNWLVLSRKASS